MMWHPFFFKGKAQWGHKGTCRYAQMVENNGKNQQEDVASPTVIMESVFISQQWMNIRVETWLNLIYQGHAYMMKQMMASSCC